jgi:predicted RNA binding protein YcfA (HicA-like mRNA interferase family)
MKLPPSAKNITTIKIVHALERDGFRKTTEGRGHVIYRHSDGRKVEVSFHHAGDAIRPKTLKLIMSQARWTVKDLQRLKLISRSDRL